MSTAIGGYRNLDFLNAVCTPYPLKELEAGEQGHREEDKAGSPLQPPESQSVLGNWTVRPRRR